MTGKVSLENGFEPVRFGGDNRILSQPQSSEGRELKTTRVEFDLVIVGGGIAGVCAAISAARQGKGVALVQDRPVLGGNASSEVRLWALGATSHMGNNNRWSRESGVVGEILEENLYRNPEGNPLVFDTVLLDMVTSEPNITLLLNTVVYEIAKNGDDRISSCTGFCPVNATRYVLKAPVFMDCSGDGILAFLAGAAFRMGAESKDEFGELLAPQGDYGYLLGHSLYFYSKDLGKPVRYVAPSFALKDITEIPRYRSIQLKEFGCKLWWIEYGGRLDTVHASEEIKWELWKIIYGVWNYIKNSGEFPEAETHTLEWVGTIPGKRESRRFEGLYMIRQQDVVEQKRFEDAVAHGGWALDLHPADGVYSNLPGCSQWHSKGVYQIPLRVTISRDIRNLVFGGRIISASHVAFGSTRVMVTCGYLAQATAQAACYALDQGIDPEMVVSPAHITRVRTMLQRAGQHIPHQPHVDPDDRVNGARLEPSSRLELNAIPPDGPWLSLRESAALLLPVCAGKVPPMVFYADADGSRTLEVQLRCSEKLGNYTPETILESMTLELRDGEQEVRVAFNAELERDGYVFVTFAANEKVRMRTSTMLVSGVMTVFNGQNKAVSNNGRQSVPEGSGVDSFEFWTPRRRPDGGLLAFRAEDPVFRFEEESLRNGYDRPFGLPNAWVAAVDDPAPRIRLSWDEAKDIRTVMVSLDGDFDHAMESVLMGHPEAVVPFCVRDFRVRDADGELIAEIKDNHHARVSIALDKTVHTRSLEFEFDHPLPNVPAAVFSIRCFGEHEWIP